MTGVKHWRVFLETKFGKVSDFCYLILINNKVGNILRTNVTQELSLN